MLDTLGKILLKFRFSFSNKLTFMWFSCLVIGICAGSDDIGGVSCIIRNLGMSHREYMSLIRFFSSNAVDHLKLKQTWPSVVLNDLFALNAVKIGDRLLVLVDATKVAKTAKRMPGVLGLKDTVNDGWMRGHYFEQLCIVVQGSLQLFPVPIAISLLAGVIEKTESNKTLVDRCKEFITSFPLLQGCLIVGDAWYSKSKLIIGLAKDGSIAMVTRVAHNAVARKPHVTLPFEPKRRGRKRKYAIDGKVKLWTLFNGPTEKWNLNDNRGRELVVNGWCQDLMWEPLGMMVRFVGVEHPEKGKWILMCSDTEMKPESIAQAYIYRFWIEVGFRTAKSLLGSFSYRFWTKAIEKLSSFPEELDLSTLSKEVAQKVRLKVKSIELFAICSMISQGLLVYLSINHEKEVSVGSRFWMRTKRGGIACERLAAALLRIELKNLAQAERDSQGLEKFIQEKQVKYFQKCEIDRKLTA